jgi:hypothetical protein
MHCSGTGRSTLLSYSKRPTGNWAQGTPTLMRGPPWSPARPTSEPHQGSGVRRRGRHVCEILVGVDSILLAGGNQGVEAGDVLPGSVVADEEVVLPSERRRAERSLRAVVVHGQPCVVKEARQRAPLVERVPDGLA